MPSQFNLQPLLEIMQSRTDEASRRLGQLIAAEQSAKSRLQLLEQYRAEYAQKMREAVAGGVTPLVLRNYEGFLARIDEAIAQQGLAVVRSEQSTAAGQAHWREQHKRKQAIDALSQRHEEREMYRQNRIDQKQQDEFAARRFTLPDLAEDD